MKWLSLVCEVTMRLVSHKPIGGNNTNLELFSSQNSLQSYATSVPKRGKRMSAGKQGHKPLTNTAQEGEGGWENFC